MLSGDQTDRLALKINMICWSSLTPGPGTPETIHRKFEFDNPVLHFETAKSLKNQSCRKKRGLPSPLRLQSFPERGFMSGRLEMPLHPGEGGGDPSQSSAEFLATLPTSFNSHVFSGITFAV